MVHWSSYAKTTIDRVHHERCHRDGQHREQHDLYGSDQDRDTAVMSRHVYVSSLTTFLFRSGTVSTVPGLLCLMRLSTCQAKQETHNLGKSDAWNQRMNVYTSKYTLREIYNLT